MTSPKVYRGLRFLSKVLACLGIALIYIAGVIWTDVLRLMVGQEEAALWVREVTAAFKLTLMRAGIGLVGIVFLFIAYWQRNRTIFAGISTARLVFVGAIFDAACVLAVGLFIGSVEAGGWNLTLDWGVAGGIAFVISFLDGIREVDLQSQPKHGEDQRAK